VKIFRNWASANARNAERKGSKRQEERERLLMLMKWNYEKEKGKEKFQS